MGCERDEKYQCSTCFKQAVRTQDSDKDHSKQNSSTTLQKRNTNAMEREWMGLGFSLYAVPLIQNAPLFQKVENEVDSKEQSSTERWSRLHLSRAGEERNNKTRVDSS